MDIVLQFFRFILSIVKLRPFAGVEVKYIETHLSEHRHRANSNGFQCNVYATYANVRSYKYTCFVLLYHTPMSVITNT